MRETTRLLMPRSHPDGLNVPSPRRPELAAAIATAAVVAQLLFAPLTLLMAAALVGVGRVSRWRPHWLAVPALAGVAWSLTSGLSATLARSGAGAGRIAGYLWVAAVHPSQSFDIALSALQQTLKGELPIGLLVATAEAGALLWLSWRRDPDWWRQTDWRPGVLAVIRLRAAARALACGHTVTRDGCALGVRSSTGQLSTISWRDAEGGVLLTGRDSRDLDEPAMAAVCAAIRLRKSVIALDLAGSGVAARIASLGSHLGVPVAASPLPASAAGVTAGLGLAIRQRSVATLAVDRTGPADTGQRALDELRSLLVTLRDLQLRADCVACISGCEQVDPSSLTDLPELGRCTGTAVLMSTTSAAQAGCLAGFAGVIVTCGQMAIDQAQQLASVAHAGRGWTASAAKRRAAVRRRRLSSLLAAQRAGTFTITTRGRVMPGCVAVPIAVGMRR